MNQVHNDLSKSEEGTIGRFISLPQIALGFKGVIHIVETNMIYSIK
jgi:hypothetical protein